MPEQETKRFVFDMMLEQQALHEYAKQYEISVSEEDIQQRITDAIELYAGENEGTLVNERLQMLFANFKITAEDYVHLVLKPQLLANKVTEPLREEQGIALDVQREDFEKFKTQYMVEHEDEIAHFTEKHKFHLQPFSPEKTQIIQVDGGNYEVYERDGNTYFANPFFAVDKMLLRYEQVFSYLSEQYQLTYFCHYTLADFKSGFEQLNKAGPYKEESEALLKLIKYFEK